MDADLIRKDTNSHLPKLNIVDNLQPHLKFNFETRTFGKFLRQTRNNNINNFNVCGYTALHCAATAGSVKLMKLLLNNGADINAQDKVQGKTALQLALTKRSKISAEVLLKRKANVNVKDKRKWTALHQAVLWHDIPADLLKIIIDKSSNLNAKTILGRTALHLALRKRSAIAIEQLLNYGQNIQIVDTKDGRGKAALHFAAQWYDIPSHLFNEILQKTLDVNARDKTGSTALHLAMNAKSITTTAQLLKHVDVNVDDDEKQTLIQLMDLWPDVPVYLRQIIKDRFNADWERSPVQTLSNQTNGKCQLGDYNVNHLPEKFVKDKPNTFAEEELRQLCAHDYSSSLIEKIENLIGTGINVNAKDRYGRNALHFLCRNNSSSNLINVIQLLIKRGINVNAEGVFGQNALHYLCQKNSTSNVIDAIQMLIQCGIEVNAKDNVGWNALHYLCVYNSSSNLIRAVKLVIEYGIDVNTKSNREWNALHYLCLYNSSSGLVPVIQILIQKGINIVCDSHDARSILREHYRKSNKKEIIKLLDGAAFAQNESTLKASNHVEL